MYIYIYFIYAGERARRDDDRVGLPGGQRPLSRLYGLGLSTDSTALASIRPLRRVSTCQEVRQQRRL